MASSTARISDLRGLTPAIDSRRLNGHQLISGDNIFFDSNGVMSGFGNEYLIDVPFATGDYIQGIRAQIKGGDRTFTFTEDAILEYVEATGDFEVVYVIPSTAGTPYRWTYGYLNDVLYFCHPAAGIIYYNITTEAKGRWRDAADITITTPLAVAVSNGRLCIIDETWFYWSETSDGFTFTPSTGGAGTQKINDRVSGDPILCAAYKSGVLTLTSGGIMKSEFTGDRVVFRHRAVNTLYSPINSFCVFQTVEDTVVFLDKRGFFQSAGETPQPFTPVWNEFLIQELEKFRILERENIRVEWDANSRLLYLSVSVSDVTPVYDYAYVLYQPSDKWSKFTETHYGIVPFNIESSVRRRQYHGFIDENRKPRIWTGAPQKQITATNPSQYLYIPLVQYPLHTIDLSGGNTASVSASACAMSALEESTIASIAGYYTYDAADPYPESVEGLGATARVGLFRFTTDQYPDMMSEVSDITVGSHVSTDGNTPIEDFSTIPDGTDDEDYNAAMGAADYGFGRVTYVNFDMNLITSCDGRSSYDTQVPVLARFFPDQRYYTTTAVGVFHILEFKATDPGQTFHLKMLELNGILAGRLD